MRIPAEHSLISSSTAMARAIQAQKARRLKGILSRKREQTSAQLWFFFVLSMVAHPMLAIFGAPFALLIAPVVIYMIWSREPLYVPALILLSTTMSSLSYIIFGTLLILFLADRTVYQSTEMRLIAVLTLISSVISVGAIAWGIFGAGTSLVSLYQQLSYGLATLPLFFGYAIGQRLERLNINHWVIPFAALLVLHFFSAFLGYAVGRLTVVGSIIMTTILLLAAFTPKSVSAVRPEVKLIAIGYFLVTLTSGGFKFTSQIAIVITFLTVYTLWQGKARALVRYFLGPVLVGAIIVVPIWVIQTTYGQTLSHYGTVDYLDIASYPAYIKFKLFGDRGVLWYAAWEAITTRVSLLPPNEWLNLEYETLQGETISDVDFGAHNTVLEALLRLGWVAGLSVATAIVMILVRMGQSIMAMRRHKSFVLLTSSVFGVIASIMLFGQYILQSPSAFAIFTMAGAVLAFAHKQPKAKSVPTGAAKRLRNEARSGKRRARLGKLRRSS